MGCCDLYFSYAFEAAGIGCTSGTKKSQASSKLVIGTYLADLRPRSLAPSNMPRRRAMSSSEEISAERTESLALARLE